MAKDRYREDHTVYQRLLESTRDAGGVEHRDQAVKLLAEKLAADASRATEYAVSRAREVADGFANSHKPETDHGQMTFDIDSYLVIAENETIRVDRAMSAHTRQWLDVGAHNHAVVAAAWSAKDLYGRKLLAIQDEHKCSMWKAEQIFRGDSA